MSAKRYVYVGPEEVRRSALAAGGESVCVRTPADLVAWIRRAGEREAADGGLAVTFVVTADGVLRLADRRTEHVACAGGEAVLSAGEMTFSLQGTDVGVLAASNQSTGYCPEPDSWTAVEAVLDRLGISHPGEFTEAFTFRRCCGCGTTNIVKDSWYECAVCQAPLSRDWNCGPWSESDGSLQ